MYMKIDDIYTYKEMETRTYYLQINSHEMQQKKKKKSSNLYITNYLKASF